MTYNSIGSKGDLVRRNIIRIAYGDVNPIDHVILYDSADPPNAFRLDFSRTVTLKNGDYIDAIHTSNPRDSNVPSTVEVILTKADGTREKLV